MLWHNERGSVSLDISCWYLYCIQGAMTAGKFPHHLPQAHNIFNEICWIAHLSNSTEARGHTVKIPYACGSSFLFSRNSVKLPENSVFRKSRTLYWKCGTPLEQHCWIFFTTLLLVLYVGYPFLSSGWKSRVW